MPRNNSAAITLAVEFLLVQARFGDLGSAYREAFKQALHRTYNLWPDLLEYLFAEYCLPRIKLKKTFNVYYKDHAVGDLGSTEANKVSFVSTSASATL